MKDLLYVSKINFDNKDEIYIYISMKDLKKYAFIKKGNFLIHHNDKKLLDVLNNVDGIVYGTKNSNQSTVKGRIQKALALLGVGVTFVSVYPKMSDIISYSLKRVKSSSYSDSVDVNTSDSDFINNFAISVNKNEDFSEEEKEKIIDGYKKYFCDWGYLFDEIDKQYVLRIAENVNVNRDASLPPWAGGSYWMNNIRIIKGSDLAVVTHEGCHAFSDRGLYVGSISGFGFGYAMNEGINTSVNDFYYVSEKVYARERYSVFLLSLLIEKEDLIKGYQKEGALYIVKALKDSGVDYLDAVKYISMMDVELFLAGYDVLPNYYLPDDFYDAKDKLFAKMFKDKYGYDLSETVLEDENFTIMDFDEVNFLLDEFKLFKYKENDLIREEYSFTKNDLVRKSSDFDYSEKFVKASFYQKMLEYDSLIFLDGNFEDNIVKAGSIDAYCSNNWAGIFSEEDLKRAKTMFSHITVKNTDCYAKCLVNYLLSNEEWSLEFATCYMREAQYNLHDQEERNIFNEVATELLRENGRDDIVDLYNNTTIRFETFDEKNIKNSVISDDYMYLREKEDFLIFDDRRIVVRLEDDEVNVYDARQGENTLFFRDVDEKYCQTFDKLFGYDGGRYCYAYINTNDRDSIKIMVGLNTKTPEKTLKSAK